MHAATGQSSLRQPIEPAPLDRRATADLRLEARRDIRLVVAVLFAAIAAGLAGLAHSLS